MSVRRLLEAALLAAIGAFAGCGTEIAARPAAADPSSVQAEEAPPAPAPTLNAPDPLLAPAPPLAAPPLHDHGARP